MDQTVKLLDCVARNAKMGFDSVDQLLTKTQDANLRGELVRQRQDYSAACMDAENRLFQAGAEPGRKSPASRAGAWVGIEMSTMADRSSAHLADLVIQGTTMGVIDTTKARNECEDASAEAQGVAGGFIAQQQDAIERMKGFLR